MAKNAGTSRSAILRRLLRHGIEIEEAMLAAKNEVIKELVVKIEEDED
jgi:hypothetical protein